MEDIGIKGNIFMKFKLSEWAKHKNIPYSTAYKQWSEGRLDVSATQMPSGSIFIEDPEMAKEITVGRSVMEKMPNNEKYTHNQALSDIINKIMDVATNKISAGDCASYMMETFDFKYKFQTAQEEAELLKNAKPTVSFKDHVAPLFPDQKRIEEMKNKKFEAKKLLDIVLENIEKKHKEMDDKKINDPANNFTSSIRLDFTQEDNNNQNKQEKLQTILNLFDPELLEQHSYLKEDIEELLNSNDINLQKLLSSENSYVQINYTPLVDKEIIDPSTVYDLQQEIEEKYPKVEKNIDELRRQIHPFLGRNERHE